MRKAPYFPHRGETRRISAGLRWIPTQVLTTAFPVLLMLSADETIRDSKAVQRATFSLEPCLPSSHAVQFRKRIVLKTLHSLATICVFSAALAALLPACSSTDGGTPATAGAAGAAGAPGAAGAAATAGASATAGAAGAGALTGDASRGAQLWVKPILGCNGCHGEHAEGATAPNITKSATGGIGAFTYAQFHAAVREGKNKQGGTLCFMMQPFAASDASEQDIADLYAFQQAQPAVDTPSMSQLCRDLNDCCTGEHK